MSRRKTKLDPAVSALLAESQQKKPKPAAHRRPRVIRTAITLELNADLVPVIRQVAEHHGISPAGLVDRLLADALARWAEGEIDLEGYLQPSRSPRYDWVVDVDARTLAAQVLAALATEPAE